MLGPGTSRHMLRLRDDRPGLGGPGDPGAAGLREFAADAGLSGQCDGT